MSSLLYWQAARKLAIAEVDLERSEHRLETAEVLVFIFIICFVTLYCQIINNLEFNITNMDPSMLLFFVFFVENVIDKIFSQEQWRLQDLW